MGSLGDLETRGRPEMRVIRESLVPLERRERLVTRAMQDLMGLPETGAALESEDPGEPQVCGAREETWVKLDLKVTKGERAPSASQETRVRPAPWDLKAIEATRAPQGWRVPEEPQDLLDPLETQG